MRAGVARAIGKLAVVGDGEANSKVAALLEDDDEVVRKSAVLAYAELFMPGDEAPFRVPWAI